MGEPQKQKTKEGICEVHLYNNDDKKKRNVKWNTQCELWICKNCDDVVLIAMATVGKKQASQKQKLK